METWSDSTTPVLWTSHSASLTRVTYSGSTPTPWDGFSCMSIYRSIVSATGVDWKLVSYALPSSHHSELSAAGRHTLRASIRAAAISVHPSSGSYLQLAVGGTTEDSNYLEGGSIGVGFGQRHLNSWQSLGTDTIAWTGVSSATCTVFAREAPTNNALVVIDDLRLYFNEIEIPQHMKQRQMTELQVAENRALAGRLYRTERGRPRRWTLPVEFMCDSAWQQVFNWHRDGADLWLTAPDGTSYPVIGAGPKDPLGGLHAPIYDERKGTIELVSDYRERLTGPVHAEALP